MIYEYSVVLSDHSMFGPLPPLPAWAMQTSTCSSLYDVAVRMGAEGWRLVSVVAVPRCSTCTMTSVHWACGGTQTVWERIVTERHEPVGDTSMRVRRDNAGDGSPAPSREAGA